MRVYTSDLFLVIAARGAAQKHRVGEEKREEEEEDLSLIYAARGQTVTCVSYPINHMSRLRNSTKYGMFMICLQVSPGILWWATSIKWTALAARKSGCDWPHSSTATQCACLIPAPSAAVSKEVTNNCHSDKNQHLQAQASENILMLKAGHYFPFIIIHRTTLFALRTCFKHSEYVQSFPVTS